MGAQGSGRRSVKLTSIECIMEVQAILIQFRYNDLEDNKKIRDELKIIAAEYYNKIKRAQETIESFTLTGKDVDRNKLKLLAIKCSMNAQAVMQELLYNDLDSNMSRNELKNKVEDCYQETKVMQEEIERAIVK